ncbi:Dual specificity protein phosphatase 23 [Eumeta japonica]|uniref:Dual specificity protein phosphatase 23 n=1 Tax=Eumeta variegata TaxID=151549 RepID=A0A4C1U446_EUMVA|nr:Dual specificity protein phosphatase 23 [Eumeta japonica]
MSDSVCSRVETITEQEDKNLAGAQKETRNDLTVIIPENPFPEIEVDAYPPLKFSWVVPKKIAAMAFPRSRQNLQYLLNQGIRNLVTLTTDAKPPIDDFLQVIRWVEIPIEEFDIPNVEQISKFIEVCEAAEKVGQVSHAFHFYPGDSVIIKTSLK